MMRIDHFSMKKDELTVTASESFALVNSLPFAVVGADYSTLNTSGDYDLYDPATGLGALSDKYLEDRSGYLVAKLNDNRTDGTINTLQDVRYRDLVSNTTLDPINSEVRRVTFGGASDEGFSGGSGDDHLYGGAGNDGIIGGVGADYIEGNDTFHSNGVRCAVLFEQSKSEAANDGKGRLAA